jgi:hypothetical protein
MPPKTRLRPLVPVTQSRAQLIRCEVLATPRVNYDSHAVVGSPTARARNQYSAGPKLVPVLSLAAIGSLWAFARRCQPQYATPGLHGGAGGHLLHKATRING